MWWFRPAILACIAAGLTGCGYTPVSAPGGAADGLSGSILIDDPIDPEGFALVQQLERRLGLADDPQYRLSAEIRTQDEGIGITPDETISRYNLVARVRYELGDMGTGELVKSGQVQNFTSYSATSTQFATQVARRDAQERLMITLADQIAADLMLTAPDWRE